MLKLKHLINKKNTLDIIDEKFDFHSAALRLGQITSGLRWEVKKVSICMIEMPRSLDESENCIGRLTFKYKPEEIPSYELEYISCVLYEIYDKKSLVVSSCMIYNKSNQLLESSINDSAYNDSNSRVFQIICGTNLLQNPSTGFKERTFKLKLFDQEDNDREIAESQIFTIDDMINNESSLNIDKESKFKKSLMNIINIESNPIKIKFTKIFKQRQSRASKDIKKFSIKLVNFEKLERISIYKYFSQTGIKILPSFCIDMSSKNIDSFGTNLHQLNNENKGIYAKFLKIYLKSIQNFSTEISLPFTFGAKLKNFPQVVDCFPLNQIVFTIIKILKN